MSSFLEGPFLRGPDSKHSKMKQVVNEIEEFIRTKREDTAMAINLLLQSLSVTIDLTIFDPHTNVASQFFVSLYELMNKMEENSVFAWNCIDVLTTASRNPSARIALIDTYQFIPSLSRLLGDQLSLEKKLRLLRLMQDLTCGIKISWQIPHLPHLMITLTRWIESQQQDIVTMSLGILANLCYKNLPAAHTLLRNVDVKKVLQIGSSLAGPTEIYLCKLFIILDMNGDVPATVLSKVATVTFDSIPDTFKMRDAILLRQIVDFFLDVGQQNSLDFLVSGDMAPLFKDKLNVILNAINRDHSKNTGDYDEAREPECMAVVFEFINFLIEKNVASVVTFPVILSTALKWIHTDLVSSQALLVLKSIAVRLGPEENHILQPLVQGLPLFFATLDEKKCEDGPGFVDQNKKTSGILQLMRAMVQVPNIRPRILEDLKEDTIGRIFKPLLANEGFLGSECDIGDVETINLYAHGVALVNALAEHELQWMSLQGRLFRHKQIQMVLAQGIHRGPKETKTIILEMAKVSTFPHNFVAEALSELQPTPSSQDTVKVKSSNTDDLTCPVLSVSHLRRIDGVLKKFETYFVQRQEGSVLTSDVIELYEYKLASMGNAERATMASVEAASERCAHLQHRTAQMATELNRLHQLLYHVQQNYEATSKLKEGLAEQVAKLKGQVEVDKGKLKVCTSQLASREAELNVCTAQLNDYKKKNHEYKELLAKLKENAEKLETSLHEKKTALRNAQQTVQDLSQEIIELKTLVAQRNAELEQASSELANAKKEIDRGKEILDTITQYALKQTSSTSSSIMQ